MLHSVLETSNIFQAPTLEMLVDVPNPSVPLGAFFTCNQITWNGPEGLAASGGADIRIYAPSTFALGSSCVHLNEATYPSGNANELMTPFSSAGHANHWPGPICIGILRDIGWVLAPDVGIEEAATHSRPIIFPNPVHDRMAINASAVGIPTTITVVDVSGRSVLVIPAALEVDASSLAPGTYFATWPGAMPVRFQKD